MFNFLKPNDCGNHHWGEWHNKNRIHEQDTRVRETRSHIVRERYQVRNCEHEGCKATKERWNKIGKIGLREVDEAMRGERRIVQEHHIREEYQPRYFRKSW